ncbi:MAG: vitamin B12-dependent ribonucleotide reductase [Candidatus Eisenbacteria bacterium]|nr:vitamin B12-dependent ribonucleotide reductase [Candidatus Eisenbacteria bacterium]
MTPNALRVLERRYLKKDRDGKSIETPEEMFLRVARNVAGADLIYHPDADMTERVHEFYSLMASLSFLPNSPTLMNAGRELQQLSACFVLPVDDSMDSIFEAIKDTALIHKSGGGTGFSFNRIRPKDDRVLSTGGAASGPISFMRVFNSATDVVKQGGTRRGANMGILNIDHPDVLDFITCKTDNDSLSNFNISVGVTGEFMEAVKENKEYELVNPSTGEPVKKLNAKAVFDLLVHQAWLNGEPGLIFLDRINRDNPTPSLGQIESTNPCGEAPLLPYEACNLGSVNLSIMLKRGGDGFEIDYEKLGRTVRSAVHFLDNVIDVNSYPLEKIARMTRGTRKIGLGVMGFADMLIQLRVPYDSEEAFEIAAAVMKFIGDEAREASKGIALDRGVFPNFDQSIYASKGLHLRNATLTTIAPTGSLSIIAGCSSGIEPLYAITYVRNIMDNEKLVEVHPEFEQIAKEEGFYSRPLMEEIAERGTVRGISQVPKWVERTFVTAHDLTPEWHVKMQAAFQKYTDNAVSKTVNFSNSATADDVRKVFLLAHQEGLKGITIYRDGSRKTQVLKFGKKEKAEGKTGIIPRERPAVTRGRTERMGTGCGNLYVTINEDSEGLCEVFAQMGKSGGCAASQIEATGRLVSLALRSGIDPITIVRQLKGIRCPSPLWYEGSMVLSCADAIGRVLERHLREKTAGGIQDKPGEASKSMSPPASPGREWLLTGCPECGGSIDFVEGCIVCRSCGFSRCG